MTTRVQKSLSPVIRVTRETHEAPPEILERMKRAGGVNCFGEANFRVVWGGSRLTWIGGRWTDRDEHGNILRETIETRRVPKYLPVERWHIERWMPPESYGSPEAMGRADDRSGRRHPDPGAGAVSRARGIRALLHAEQARAGNSLPLTPAACDWIVRAVEWARRQPRRRAAARLRREKRGATGLESRRG